MLVFNLFTQTVKGLHQSEEKMMEGRIIGFPVLSWPLCFITSKEVNRCWSLVLDNQSELQKEEEEVCDESSSNCLSQSEVYPHGYFFYPSLHRS